MTILFQASCHILPLGDQLVNKLSYEQFQLRLHRLLAQISVIDNTLEAFDLTIVDV